MKLTALALPRGGTRSAEGLGQVERPGQSENSLGVLCMLRESHSLFLCSFWGKDDH